jgi:hypothetical protein
MRTQKTQTARGTARGDSNATSPKDLERIRAMFDDIADPVFCLKARWSCEREFEDINDYGKVIARKLPSGFKLEKMTKAPFGFHFSIGTDAVYAIKTTARAIGWVRIK